MSVTLTPFSEQYYKHLFILISKITKSEEEFKHSICKNIRKAFRRHLKRLETIKQAEFFSMNHNKDLYNQLMESCDDTTDKLIKTLQVLERSDDVMKKYHLPGYEMINDMRKSVYPHQITMGASDDK